MRAKIVNLLVKYSNQEQFCVEIRSKMNSTLKNDNCIVQKIEKDYKTDENLQIQCRKCQESIQLNLYFYKSEQDNANKIQEIEEIEIPEVKLEPEFEIKQEEEENTDPKTIENESPRSIDEDMPIQAVVTNKPSSESSKEVETSKPVKIPEGVVLPDLTQLKTPYYMSVDQPDGTKVWIGKTRNKDVRISNFDFRSSKCDLCGFQPKNFSLQDRHRKNHFFQQETDEKCRGCQENFPDPSERVSHTYFCPKKDTIDVLSCGYCNYKAPIYLKLRHHIALNHGPKQDIYRGKSIVMCHICSKEFQRCKINAHLLTHSVEDGQPFGCAHCDSKFTARNGLRTHLTTLHFKHLAKRSCHLCPSAFKTQQEFDKHLTIRHGIGESLAVTCTVCGKTLATRNGLNYHMKTQHKDASEKPKYECPHCQKYFFKKFALKNHISTHLPESERPYKCWCGRGFVTRCKLVKHKLEHTDPDKTFHVCSVCGVKMKYKQSLKVHMRIHTGEQPYECNFCSRKFADRGNYRVHMKQHERVMGLKLTFTQEERRLINLNVLKPDNVIENPGRSGTEEINQFKNG